MRFAIILCFLPILFSGCVHNHHRRSTVHHARNVGDIQTQIVLDNLAKFASNPGSLPHFTIAGTGQTRVGGTLTAGITPSFLPSRLAGWGASAGGNRSFDGTYVITAINDPRKLELMACVYRKAVGGNSCSEAGCPTCAPRLNRFYFGLETPGKTPLLTSHGKEIFEIEINGEKFDMFKTSDRFGDEAYFYLDSGEQVPQAELEKPSVQETVKQVFEPLDVKKLTELSGQITSECIESGWFTVCDAKQIRKMDPCCLVGKYCDTCVVVPECHRDKLTKLTMVILDIAVHKEAEPPKVEVQAPEKQTVVAYLNSSGSYATSENDLAMTVTLETKKGEDLSALFNSSAETEATNDQPLSGEPANLDNGEAPSEPEAQTKSIPQEKTFINGVQSFRTLSTRRQSFQIPRKELSRQPGAGYAESELIRDALTQ